MNGHRQREAESRIAAAIQSFAIALCAFTVAVTLGGCATTAIETPASPTSVETIEYYPFQVKGYQNTYLKRRIVVLMPTDARDFKDAGATDHRPLGNDPAVGVVVGQSGAVEQRLYGDSIAPIVQRAIVGAAGEAGMIVSTSDQPLDQALRSQKTDYILASQVTRCWIVKRRAAGAAGPLWFSSADFAIHVAIYKPPFAVAFWEGDANSVYEDPPPIPPGQNPEDETEIYDHPGEVLSVALTRAVAGIFKRDSLHQLMLEDQANAGTN